MRYDREITRARHAEEEDLDWDEADAPYGSTFHGYAMGYGGGSLRSRGSFEAGQLRSGMNPRDEFEFRWGDGYVGGRGYGGTNYDLEHGYRVGGVPGYSLERSRPFSPDTGTTPIPRGGASWSGYLPDVAELYGPARYGYGPYFERLRRQRRADDEIRADVEDAIFYDTWVDADSVEIEVEDGIVTLRGTLPNFDEVRFATDDAWDVDGVRGVRSEFDVRPRNTARTDEAALYTGLSERPGAVPEGEERKARGTTRSAKKAQREEGTTVKSRSAGSGKATPRKRASAQKTKGGEGGKDKTSD